MEKMKKFPENFLWGAATSAAQIEGGCHENGRTDSIWDTAPAEKIKNGADCRTGTDHYHHWREDVELMKEIGLRSYRFSVSWSRIMSEEGKISSEGLAFYSDLINALIENNIEPILTVYHWDLPVWIHKKGGWLSDQIVPLFTAYTEVLAENFGDRVKYWVIMNEPQCFVTMGYIYGKHAPFMHRVDAFSRLSRNAMLAAHKGTETIRCKAAVKPQIGIAMAAGAFVPADTSDAAIAGAYHETFFSRSGKMTNRWWSDPLLLGKGVRAFGIFRLKDKDIKEIKTDFDFIGLNIYSPMGKEWQSVPEEKRNSLGWVNEGQGLYWGIRFFYERYHLPVMVTENGMCDNDVLTDGCVHDTKRIRFMQDYIGNVQRAVNEGIPVIGYQYWSLLDNFEWADGYEPRFGLVYVDYATCRRTLKDSAYYYADVIRNNGGERK